MNDPDAGIDTLLYSASIGTTKTLGACANFEHVFLHPQGWSSFRALEASCSTDTDSDGVMDFDEENRFFTDINSQDSDGDSIHDKQEIRSYTFHGTDHPNCPVWDCYSLGFPDIDGDFMRAELDTDTDNDGLADGAEDLDFDGNSPETGETCVYDSLNIAPSPPPDSLVISLILDPYTVVVLNWTPVEGATGYPIYGDTIPYSTGDLLEVVYGDTTWTDLDTQTRPSPYFYYVTATVE